MQEKEKHTGDISLVKISGVENDKQNGSLKVSVVDIDMPFMSMVSFMVKWAIAAIPALIILTLVGTIAMGVIAGLTGNR